MREKCDKIIIGAGFYGLYAALHCGVKNQRIIVLECDPGPFRRATYINQARVHQGYHYPRSISTAMKSAGYFERFHQEFAFCINREFEKVYATSVQYSWSDGRQFRKFCEAASIPCEEVYPEEYFKKGMCDGAFITREYTYDAMLLKAYYLDRLSQLANVRLLYDQNITAIENDGDDYICRLSSGQEYAAPYVLNAAYAGTNQILELAGFEKFKIKYELCEIILCDADERLKKCGITVMDGHRFSIGMTAVMIFTAVFMIAYSFIVYLFGNPVEGWTTIVLFLSFAFFGLFGLITIIIKYLQILVDLVFRRKRYSFESLEKLTK